MGVLVTADQTGCKHQEEQKIIGRDNERKNDYVISRAYRHALFSVGVYKQAIGDIDQTK